MAVSKIIDSAGDFKYNIDAFNYIKNQVKNFSKARVLKASSTDFLVTEIDIFDNNLNLIESR